MAAEQAPVRDERSGKHDDRLRLVESILAARRQQHVEQVERLERQLAAAQAAKVVAEDRALSSPISAHEQQLENAAGEVAVIEGKLNASRRRVVAFDESSDTQRVKRLVDECARHSSLAADFNPRLAHHTKKIEALFAEVARELAALRELHNEHSKSYGQAVHVARQLEIDPRELGLVQRDASDIRIAASKAADRGVKSTGQSVYDFREMVVLGRFSAS